MKKLTLLVATLLTLGISSLGYAQQLQLQTSVPHAIKYQAIARNGKGELISNQNVSFRISILQGSESGSVVYRETQLAVTNQFGLANLSIGKGKVTDGDFNDIQWGQSSYFVRVEFDPNGGTNYSLVSTSEMLSVPYALYAEQSNFPIKTALVATNQAEPIKSPENGMLVYNTVTSGTSPYNVIPGYYYNAGTPALPNWVSLSGSGKNTNSVDRVLVVGTNETTYGGSVQDNVVGSATSAPTGNNNTAFGAGTFGGNASTNPTGAENTAVGYNVMNSITSGTENTSIGSQSMFKLTSGVRNTATGFAAEHDLTTGNWNTADGDSALYKNTTGYANTGTGYDVFRTNTTGSRNTTDGYEAMYFSTTGSSNTGIGFAALDHNTTGSWNTGVGDSAIASNKTGTENTAIGYQALAKSTPISDNTAVGYRALYNTTSDASTAVGHTALYNNTSGLHNSATGYQALYSNVSGSSNTANGYHALRQNTGTGNTAVGDSAMTANTSGGGNVAVGDIALVGNTTGSSNVAIGWGTLQANTTGGDNTGSGAGALASNTTGGFNTATGQDALDNNTTASYNTADGYFAFAYNTTGAHGLAEGSYALSSNTTGQSNTAGGYYALYSNTTTSRNTAFGDSALYNNNSYTGYDNTALGYQAALSSCGAATITNSTVIGAHATVCESNNLVLGANGSNSVHVSIGASYTDAALNIADGNSSDSNINCHIKSDGTAPTGSVIGAWATSVTVASGSTDTKGNFTINVTGVPAAWSAIKISFNKTYGSAPIVLLTSANATAGGATMYYVDQSATTTTDFTVYIRAANGGSGNDPSYNYFVIE